MKKDNTIFKAMIICHLKNGTVIYGNGTVEGFRSANNTEGILTATFSVPLPKQLKLKCKTHQK